jgi:hypothetical protein
MGRRDNPDLDLYGFWQTETFKPPIAEGGRVPRNEFDNVELFQPSMLPIGCVHIKSPYVKNVCRKLNIDFAAAVTGFDAHGGWSHPVLDGFIICKEFESVVRDACIQEEQEYVKKQIEQRQQRVWDRWKNLLKMFFIRQSLKQKYSNKTNIESSLFNGKSSSTSVTTEQNGITTDTDPLNLKSLAFDTGNNGNPSTSEPSKNIILIKKKSASSKSIKRKSNESDDSSIVEQKRPTKRKSTRRTVQSKDEVEERNENKPMNNRKTNVVESNFEDDDVVQTKKTISKKLKVVYESEDDNDSKTIIMAPNKLNDSKIMRKIEDEDDLFLSDADE